MIYLYTDKEYAEKAIEANASGKMLYIRTHEETETVTVDDYEPVTETVEIPAVDDDGNEITYTQEVTVNKVVGSHEETETTEYAELVIAPVGYYVCYKDNYTDGTLNPNFEAEELAKAKISKIAENDIQRDKALNGGVEYKGIMFDSDTDQKVNLMATVELMSDDQTVVWYGMNNDSLKCTKEDLYNIGGLIIDLHSFCWMNNAEIKGAIADAKTIEEVNSIIIDYTIIFLRRV